MALAHFIMMVNSSGVTVDPEPEPEPGVTVVNTYKTLSNRYVDVTFSEGVYALGEVPVTTANFEISDFVPGGTTAIAISAAKMNNHFSSATATSLIGGEYTIRVFITLTGTPTGAESFRVRCTVYSPSGVLSVVNSDTVFLNITPLMLWDYLETGSVTTTGLGIASIYDVMAVANFLQTTDADRPLDADGVIYFDRDNSEYLTAGDVGAVDFQKGNSFTVVIKRLRVLNSGTGGYIIANRANSPSNNGWAIQTGVDNSLFFALHDGTNQGFCDVDDFNGSAERSVLFFVNNNGTMNIYDHEGSTLGTTGNATGIGVISYTGVSLLAGRRGGITTSDFEGYWEKIGIFNKALSLSERNRIVQNI